MSVAINQDIIGLDVSVSVNLEEKKKYRTMNTCLLSSFCEPIVKFLHAPSDPPYL